MPPKHLILSFLLGIGGSASAQQSIEYETNGWRLNDVVNKSVVEYFPAGDSGEDILWDFRELLPRGERYPVAFCCDSDSVCLSIDPTTMYKYEQSGDTLKLIGFETPLKLVTYDTPFPLLAYPFRDGDYLDAQYHGAGDYCKTLLMDNQGTFSVDADATGCIILADGDTVRNVLRVHSTQTTSVCLYAPNDTLVPPADEEGNLKQEIEERYQWYARGYRYPLYETVTLTCYDDLTPVSCVQSAYRYLPDEQILLNDSINEEIQRQDSLALAEEIDIFPHAVSLEGSTLHLQYDLLAEAHINALICNSMGMVFDRKSTSAPEGEGYQMSFDCSGLNRGEYVLYINVNGKIYNEKFQIK